VQPVAYRDKDANDPRPLAGWFPCADYPAWLEAVQRAIRKRAPGMEVVFWTYNWGWAPAADRLRLIEGDAVKVPFPEFDRFVSNLPYSVSTPIIFKLLTYDFKKAVVMVQKEFADRMTAPVGSTEYSRLTVNLFYKADCRILENVPASRFKPKPKVDSALVEIVPRKAPFDVIDEKTFFKVTEVAFNHRRKKIGTALKNARMIEKDWELPYLDDRIETLTPAQIGELSDRIYALHKDNL
jgi:16S rRNA (adenine1518-N6/adenine1519-N6)-dimethyltransferase